MIDLNNLLGPNGLLIALIIAVIWFNKRLGDCHKNHEKTSKTLIDLIAQQCELKGKVAGMESQAIPPDLIAGFRDIIGFIKTQVKP